jgi:cytochrome c peroxidase
MRKNPLAELRKCSSPLGIGAAIVAVTGLTTFLALRAIAAPRPGPASTRATPAKSQKSAKGHGGYSWQAPAGFDEMPIPPDNPMTQEKIALGHQLYFDTRLSGDGKHSCYGCHVIENGLTDGRPVAIGANDKVLTRSAPTMWNVGYYPELYWDGRTKGLEAQVLGAWKGANMGADPEKATADLDKIAGYHDQFMKVFNTGVTPAGVQKAVASYMRTLLCGDTPFDRFQQGDKNAISEPAKRGWELFRGKASCGTCHAGILFTDLQYHNVGVGMDKENPDVGRSVVTKDEKDTGAFKTPTLRNITRTAPYFHNGQAATLHEAIAFMTAGGFDNPHLDRTNLKPVQLSESEVFDLVAFLESLECGCQHVEYPKLP